MVVVITNSALYLSYKCINLSSFEKEEKYVRGVMQLKISRRDLDEYEKHGRLMFLSLFSINILFISRGE